MCGRFLLRMAFARILLTTFFLVCSLFLGSLFFFSAHFRVDFSRLEHYDPGMPSRVLDDRGTEWDRFELDRREPIDYTQIPSHLVHAFMAAEDHNFFTHHGLSWKGIIRSTLVNLYHGRIVQGASTITQQLVRLLFFDARRTFSRKFKEQLYSLLVERQFSKEHILQTYLNHVYFGCGIYGVEAACQRFWGKKTADISIDEAAMLAAIMKSPWHYCPLLFPLSARKRRNVVLHSMKKLSLITQTEYEHAIATPLTLVSDISVSSVAPHVRETLRVMLEELVGKEALYTGGLTIQTTINVDIQKQAENEFVKQLHNLRKELEPKLDGALICMHGKTGEIKALVGGVDFSASQFNRALQAKRQFGSIFKPIVYMTAVERGARFTQTEVDEPFEVGAQNNLWKPRNDNRRFQGTITLARALSHSNNIVTIKTLLSVGAEAVCERASKFRISGTIEPYPSIALGCVDGTLKEAVGMFNVFAQNGMYVEPHLIKWIKNRWGKKIWKKNVDKERIIDGAVCGQVTKVLGLGMSRMKQRHGVDWIKSEAIGKTGTTNDSRTCWFAGATPTYTTAIYLGCDNNKPIGQNIYASRTAFPIWLALNKSLAADKLTFNYDSALQEVLINSKTGLSTYRSDSDAITVMLPK